MHDEYTNTNEERVVVCITAQSNSKRLIDHGATLTQGIDGQLHILHVQKGDNIFNSNETLRLLQQLMVYGSAKGGIVHAFCDNDIATCIASFVQAEGITKVVMGEQPSNPMNSASGKKRRENQFQKILDRLPDTVEVVIVGRETETDFDDPHKKRKIV